MNIIGQYPEIRTYRDGRVEAIRFVLEGGITDAEIEQLKQDNQGYTGVLEHYLTLFVPPVDVQEVVAEKEAVQALLTTVAEALPDELAVQHQDIYPEWQAGMRLDAEARVRYEGGLYRVQQGHTAGHPPGVTTAALYTRIQAPGSVEPWVSGQSYAEGVRVTHKGKTWLSKVPNNIWEPGAAGVFDTIWEEVAG